MENVDGSDRYEDQSTKEQNPSLLTIILDTNPAAWSLIASTLPLSKAIADVLVFINAHLACNYGNKVAVIASHCDKAQWLYPTPTEQQPSAVSAVNIPQKPDRHGLAPDVDRTSSSSKRARLNNDPANSRLSNVVQVPNSDTDKYRPFRLVEEELVRNLQKLVTSTAPASISAHSATMIAGALTLALTYINRESVAFNESTTGANPNLANPSSTQAATADASTPGNALTNPLQARILLLTLSPSTDLAHQYIPIMNAIFACQRLSIPIDVLQLPLPQQVGGDTQSTAHAAGAAAITDSSNSTVFLQQAADATRGIFIPAVLSPPSAAKNHSSPTTSLASSALLSYLLIAFLPSPATRTDMILPTRIDVDFRAACFCHRNVISTGFVCSICLSIFCAVPEGGDCLTCGTKLGVGDYGGRPVVVPKRKRKKRAPGVGSNVGTPTPA